MKRVLISAVMVACISVLIMQSENTDVYASQAQMEAMYYNDDSIVTEVNNEGENIKGVTDDESLTDIEQESDKSYNRKGSSRLDADIVLYFDKSSITVRKDGSPSVTWHQTRGSNVIFSSSNTNVATVTSNGKTYTLKNAGSTTITAKATMGSAIKTASFKLNVTAVPFNGYKSLTFSKVRFPFANFGSKADLNLCKIMYTKAYAKKFFKSAANNGQYGNCFGMATCAGLFYAKGIMPSKIKKTDVYEWTTSGKKTTISVENQIKAMQISAASDQNYEGWLGRSTTELINAVKTDLGNNRMTVLTVSNKRLGSHAVAVIGFKADDLSKDHLIIYDSYYGPKSAKNLYLYKNKDGSYNGNWKYIAASGKTYDSTVSGTGMAYTTYSQYSNIWTKRGALTFTKY